jgi:glyoxylase-like metal-dependent hydrolase (beta-lactamase superfamily II)
MSNLRRLPLNEQVTVYSNIKNNSNVIVIERPCAEVIIDTFLFPKHNSELYDTLNRRQTKKEHYLINTHAHSDHCYGNKLFQESGAITICHEEYSKTITTEKRMIFAGKTYKSLPPRTPTPNITFSQNMSLPSLGIEVIHTPGHTLDSISIYLAEEKILITGDNTLGSYEDYFILPYFYWGGINYLINSLKTLLHFDINIVIPGHGAPMTKEKLILDLDYLEKLLDLFNQFHNEYPSNEIFEKLFFDSLTLFNEEYLKIIIDTHFSLEICLPSSVPSKIGISEVHSLNVKRLLLDLYNNKKDDI